MSIRTATAAVNMEAANPVSVTESPTAQRGPIHSITHRIARRIESWVNEKRSEPAKIAPQTFIGRMIASTIMISLQDQLTVAAKAPIPRINHSRRSSIQGEIKGPSKTQTTHQNRIIPTKSCTGEFYQFDKLGRRGFLIETS